MIRLAGIIGTVGSTVAAVLQIAAGGESRQATFLVSSLASEMAALRRLDPYLVPYRSCLMRLMRLLRGTPCARLRRMTGRLEHLPVELSLTNPGRWAQDAVHAVIPVEHMLDLHRPLSAVLRQMPVILILGPLLSPYRSCLLRLMRLLDALVNAAETHKTFHRESGMRYQVSPTRPIRAQVEPIRVTCPPM